MSRLVILPLSLSLGGKTSSFDSKLKNIECSIAATAPTAISDNNTLINVWISLSKG